MLLAHVYCCLLRQKKTSAQVKAHYFKKIIRCVVKEITKQRNAGIGNYNINLAKCLNCFGY